MGREIKQTETEWLYSQLELIASNRATKLFAQTLKEYERIVEQHGYEPRQAIDFLMEKYEVKK